MYSLQFDPVPLTEAEELAVNHRRPKESYNINVISRLPGTPFGFRDKLLGCGKSRGCVLMKEEELIAVSLSRN